MWASKLYVGRGRETITLYITSRGLREKTALLELQFARCSPSLAQELQLLTNSVQYSLEQH